MSEKTKANLKTAAKAAVALAILAAIILNYDKLKNLDVRALVQSSSNAAAAVLTILGIYLIKSVLFVVPASLIYVSVGAAFTPLPAILINLAGITLEVIVTYLLGLFLGGDYVNGLLEKNKAGQKILNLNVNNNFWVLLGIRFLPAFPIDFVSLFWGASKGKFIRYLFASVIGIMPRVILFIFLGDNIYKYIPMELIVKIIICAIPVGLVAWLIVRLVQKKKA